MPDEIISTEVTSTTSGETAEITPPGGTPPAAAPASATIDWNTVIPDDLREKDTFKNILKSENPGAELAKQLDNAQTLIGKRPAGRPADDASEDDWNKYFDSVRPKTADEYDLKPIDLGPEKKELADKINSFRTDERTGKIKAMAHKHGLPKREFEAFAKDFEAMQAEEFEAFAGEAKALEAQSDAYFDDLAKKTFGGDKDKALAYGEKLINDYTTDEQRAMLRALPENKLPSEALMIIAAIGKGVHAKYEKGDVFETTVTTQGATTLEEITAEMHKLQASDAYLNQFAGDHATVRARVTELAKKKAALLNKQ